MTDKQEKELSRSIHEDGKATPAVPAVPATLVATGEVSVDRHDVLTVKDAVKPYGQTHRFQCLHKLGPGEPFFILRAQDLTADYFVEEWCRKAEARGMDPAKVREAKQCAADMRAWKSRKYPD